MTVTDIKKALGLSLLAGAAGLDREVTGCYVGDLLSWVMGRAQEGDLWITVMGNVNAVAVAVLADVPCILLSENAPLDEDARKRAEENGIAILQSEKNAYRLAVEVSKLLGQIH